MTADNSDAAQGSFHSLPDPDRPAKRPSSLSYRPDIDGLRAVAVLLVIFDHLGTRLTGGFIGVDVFFVISGYLISSTILSEMQAGKFSIVNFYERRVRRILPALLVMMVGCSILAYKFLVPSELQAFAQSMLAALFSVSNILFWKQAGYFDLPSTMKPLLHTWSLAVEEQFYIIFPILLMVLRKWWPSRVRAAIWIVSGLTFVLACFWVYRDSGTAFFIAPLRAWELLIGTIISQHYVPAIRTSIARNLAAAAGLLLIVLPSFLYSAHTAFPGIAALPPCLGAALIILAGESGDSYAGRLLSWRPMVFVGAISYSLYLWHWPIIVFQRTSFMLVHAPFDSKVSKGAVLIVSLILGTASWKFIETPFRKGRFRPARRPLFAVNGMGVAVTALLAIFMVATHGFAFRFSPEALAVANYASFDPTIAYRQGQCFLEIDKPFSDFRPETCLHADPGKKQYLLLGDSHAAQLYPGLSTVFTDLNISQATIVQCRPFRTPGRDAKSSCRDMLSFIYSDYLLHHKVDAVLIAGRWQKEEITELSHTVSWIQQQGMPVVVFGPSIEYDQSLPRVIATSFKDHDNREIARHQSNDPAILDRDLATIVRNKWNARYISIYEDMCSKPSSAVSSAGGTALGCPVYAKPGVPMLFDTNHLTPEGSVAFAREMKEHGQLP